MRHLWLHGFASGPTSSKGRFVGERLRERGIELVIPDLNEPAFFDLTVTRMLERVDALAGADRVALFGSSLGGFTAATWAARRPGRAEVEKWLGSGRFAFDHHAYGRKEDLSSAFLADAQDYESFPLPDCPALVIQGTRDDVVDPALAREFTRRMGGRARLVELPEGHELTADLPALWRQIDGFLQATERGRPRST